MWQRLVQEDKWRIHHHEWEEIQVFRALIGVSKSKAETRRRLRRDVDIGQRLKQKESESAVLAYNL